MKRRKSIKKDKKKPKPVEEKKKVEEIKREHVPIPTSRPTAWNTSGPRPDYWPSELSKGLEDLYKPSPILFRALEGERETHQWYLEDKQERPWTLVELAMDSLQMPFLLEGKAKNYYSCVKQLPSMLADKMQNMLPTDVDVARAIEAIEDGIFWKRLAMEKFPYMIPCPRIQKFSYKSLFIQEWFSNYLSELEPYNVMYTKIKGTCKMVSPYVHVLDIKELKAPIFRKTESPKADADPVMEDMPWLMETCLPVFPYVQRLNLALVLPYLTNLTYLSVCFGFSNYERYRCFRKSRINVKDVENLFKGILNSNQIVALRIYMSAFYETDMRMAVRCALLYPVYLNRLEISNCELDDRAGRMIGYLILYHITLEEIDIKRNHLTKTGAYFIATALCMTELTNLKIFNLSENGIGCIGAMYLALMLTVNHSLRGLLLAGCRIGKSGGLLLMACLKLNKGLKRLDLSVNHIGKLSAAEEERVILDMKAHPKLAEFNLGTCGLDPVLVEFVKVLGNERRVLKTTDMENLTTVLVKKPIDRKIDRTWKAYSMPTAEDPSVHSTESGELTSIGSTATELGECLFDEIIPRKKLKRFMKATLTESLALKAIQTILQKIHRLSILRAQKTGECIKAIFAKEVATLPIKKLVKDEITKVVRRKMKKSKLFSIPEKVTFRIPIPRHVINNAIKIKLKRVPIKLVKKVVQQTIRKVQH